MKKKNESLPKPIDIGSTTNNFNNQVLINGSVKFKYVKIGAGYEEFKLDGTYYLIEFSSSDTKRILLPKVTNELSIFYIIRKRYTGEVVLKPVAGDTIEGESEITLYRCDQIIKLTNDSANTWLII